MQLNNLVLDAVNTVLNLDIPDEAYPEAVNAQVCLLAGPEAEDIWGDPAWGHHIDRRVH